MSWSRHLRATIMFFIAALIVTTVYVPQASARMGNTYGTPVDLGTPIKSASTISIYDSVIGKEDGHNVLYTTLAGEPAQFYVIDLDSYKVLQAVSLPSGKDIWSHVIAPDGTVYIASSGGRLFSYSPVSKEVSEHGIIISGETAIYGLSTDEAGNIYGGTYPKGKVWKFDPVTKQFTDYGRMSDTHSYVRALTYVDNMLYAGLGVTGKLMKLDPATGEKTDIPLPPVTGVTNGNYPYVYNLDVVDNYLFAHMSGNGISTLIAYNLETGEWRPEELTNFHGNRIFSGNNGKAYYKLNAAGGNKLVELDLATFETRVTSMMQDFSLKGGGMVDLADPQFPGTTLVNIRFDGKIGFFNLQTETYVEKPPLVQGVAIPIHNIEKGPDGRLYMSGYPGGSGSIFNPVTKENTILPLGQSESIGQIGNIVYFSNYPKAEIYQFDVTKPVAADNPVKIFSIGEEQDRPYVNTTVGSKLYIGTIPDYGKLGGALVEYDSASTEAVKHKVFRNVVQDQSIVGLAHLDGKMYGSTTIHGGLGIPASQSEAKIFVWDTVKNEKITEFTPNIPGGKITMISGLTIGPDGLLWAAANGTIFAVDPATLEVKKSKEIYTGVSSYGMWRPIHLRWGTDGMLYTDLNGKLTVIHPTTLEFQNLGVNTQLFTLGNDGNIYYAASSKLYMIPVTHGDNTVDPEEPEEPVEPKLNVWNGSFEKPLQGSAIPGWSNILQPTANTSFQLSSDKAFSGKNSLKVIDTSSSEAIAIGSMPVEVLPGEAYTMTAQLFIETGRTSFLARFYDETGKQTGADLIAHYTTGLGKWQEVKLSGTAPANAKTARLFASVSQLYMTTSYYDHFEITGKFPNTEVTAGQLNLTASKLTVEKDTLLPLQLQVNEASDLYAVKGVIHYDATHFAVDSVTVGDSFKNAFFTYDAATPGVIKIVATQTGDSSINGIADVAHIKLKAIKDGSSPVVLSKLSQLGKIDADETGKTYSPDADSTLQITIVKEFSDINGDGKVNLNDVVAVAKQVGKAYDAKFDVNQDGIVDIADVSIVATKVLNS